jgi:hypothetical protein
MKRVMGRVLRSVAAGTAMIAAVGGAVIVPAGMAIAGDSVAGLSATPEQQTAKQQITASVTEMRRLEREAAQAGQTLQQVRGSAAWQAQKAIFDQARPLLGGLMSNSAEAQLAGFASTAVAEGRWFSADAAITRVLLMPSIADTVAEQNSTGTGSLRVYNDFALLRNVVLVGVAVAAGVALADDGPKSR